MNHITQKLAMARHTTQELYITSRRILLVLGLLFCGTTAQATTYTFGGLDTTADGGTGFGSTTTGYKTAGFSTNTFINATAIQPDGKTVVVGGDSTQNFAIIGRYTINGSEDTTFNGFYSTFSVAGASATVAQGVMVLANGNIVVVGQATMTEGPGQFFVAQFLPNGNLDTTGFANPNGYTSQNVTTTSSSDSAHAVTIDSSGYIYVVGTSVDTQTNIFVAQYFSYLSGGTAGTLTNYNNGHFVMGGTTDGNLYTGIALMSTGNVLAGNGIAIEPTSGKAVITGADATGNAMLVARFQQSGAPDLTFNTTGYNTLSLGEGCAAYGVGFQALSPNAGKIVISGTDGSNFAVARFLTNGLLDSYANDTTAPFGNGLAGAQTGYNNTEFSGIGSGSLAIQADDTIVMSGQVTIGGPATLFMIASFLADGSNRNTSFNNGAGFNDSAIPTGNTNNVGNSLSLQQNGSFLVGGTYLRTTPTTNQEFATARYLGMQLVQGAMDYSYNPAVASSPGTPGFSLYPTDATSADQPEVIAMYPLSGAFAGNLYVLTQEAENPQIVSLAIDGSIASAAYDILVPAELVGFGTDVITDSQNRAVAVGTTNPSFGWIGRYVDIEGSMTKDPSFNGSSVYVESNAVSFARIAEQNVGLLIAMGQSSAVSTQGILVAYVESGDIATGLFGTGATPIGYITSATSTSTFCDMLIDSADRIYVVWQDTSVNGHIKIDRYLADGSALDGSFAQSGIYYTEWSVLTYGKPVLSFDNYGNIVVAAANATTGQIDFQQLSPASGSSTMITTGSIAQSTSLFATPVTLTKLQCDTNDRLVFNGYDANDFFVGRMVAGASLTPFTMSFSLDTTFAPYSSCLGIMKTMYSTNNPSRVSNSVCISNYTGGDAGNSNNGAILFGGYENIDVSNTVSLVGQVVGWTSGTVYTQVKRFPGALLPGTINTMYGTNGALDASSTPNFLPAGQARAINVITTGTYAGEMLVADSNGTSTTIAMLQATGTTRDASAFGGAGSPAGTINLPSMPSAAAIMVDPTGMNYYVLGTNGSVYSFTYSSTAATQFASSAVINAYAITQQASGRILVAGRDVTNSGVIVAYTPAGAIDTSFNPGGLSGATPNVPGYWYLGLSNPITAISVGATNNAQADADKIFFAYDDFDGYAAVARLLENGTELDPSFTFGTSIICSNTSQIKMQLDASGSIVLVVQAGGSGGILAARYTPSGASDILPFTVLADTSGQILENILCLSDGTTLILAAVPNATASSAFMNLARLTQTPFALDPTFNSSGTPAGVLSTNVPSASAVMEDFYALDVISAGGILVSGDNNTIESSFAAHPFLAAVVTTGTPPTKVSQSATAFGAAGTLDTTFNAAGTNAGFMNFASELQTTSFPEGIPAQVLLQLPNGTGYYVAGSTNSNSYISLMSDDDIQQSGFGSSGLLTLSVGNVSGMILAQNGGMFVIGGSGASNAGWLVYLNTINGSQLPGFIAPTGAGNVLDAHYAIAQQSNGRVLVAGLLGAFGAIIAYDSVTGAIDTTFGVNGIYTLTIGGAIYSMIVNAQDTIYFMTTNGSSGSVKQLSANGTGYLITGGSSLVSASASSNHVAFDQNNNINAVCVTTSNQITCARFLGTNISASALVTPQTFAIPSVTTPNITSMFVDLTTSPGKMIITGYDSSTTPYTPFIARITSNLTGLDTTFNNPTGVTTQNIVSDGVTTQWNAGMINADGKITVAGYASVLTDAYLMRVYGDEFIGQYLPSVVAGVQGNINTNFPALTASSTSTGILSLIGTAAASATPQVVLPAPAGGAQYVAFASGDTHSASTIARYNNANALDNTYHTTGIAVNSPAGLYSMSFLANGGLLVAGTSLFDGIGWVEQYTTTGILDPTFNSTGSTVTPYVSATPGILAIPGCVVATVAVQQSLSRIVVAGQMTNGHGALFGITSTGAVDTTFGTSGIYDTGIATTIYALVADQYDRLLIAYKHGSAVEILRLTSSGEVDTTFGNGSTGTIITGISSADSQAQVRIALDLAGNIIVAAHRSANTNVNPAISIWAYQNTTGTNWVYGPVAATGLALLASPTLTGLIATGDGNVLVSGNQSGSNNMWVARITSGGMLDTATFNSNSTAGGIVGIMQFNAGTSGTINSRVVSSIAMYGDGEISMVGTETSSASPFNNPFMSRAYDTPYTSQQPFDRTASAPGTVDNTFGAGVAPNYVANPGGITFLATTDGFNQFARAVVMQNGNDNNVVVACDGLAQTSSAGSSIFINMFDVDGLLNTNFYNPDSADYIQAGQAAVLVAPVLGVGNYDNQYVNDMLTFTVDGVSKAILVGYAVNTTPSLTGSLLVQYILTLDSPGLDPSFGGFNNNYAGVAFGDGQSLNTVGLQSNSRIIGAGLDQSGNGLLLGYTTAGNLDQSFGQDGTFVQGTTGIYTSAIDSQDRVVIAYNDGSGNVVLARILADGSDLDTTFNYPNGFVTTSITTALNNVNIRLAIDGNNNIAVAAVLTGGTTFSIVSYLPTGVINGSMNTIGGMGLTAFTMTRMLVDTNNAVIVVGYDNTDGENDTIVVARCVYDTTHYVLDNSTTVPAVGNIPFNGTNGYVKYAVPVEYGTQKAFGAFIHPDGRIIIAGAQENPPI